jgi:hypothetical protein
MKRRVGEDGTEVSTCLGLFNSRVPATFNQLAASTLCCASILHRCSHIMSHVAIHAALGTALQSLVWGTRKGKEERKEQRKKESKKEKRLVVSSLDLL